MDAKLSAPWLGRSSVGYYILCIISHRPPFLALALAPPPNETPAERAAWVRAEGQRKIEERKAALGISSAPSQSPALPSTPGDGGVEDRLAQERKEAEDKARQAEKEQEERERERRKKKGGNWELEYSNGGGNAHAVE